MKTVKLVKLLKLNAFCSASSWYLVLLALIIQCCGLILLNQAWAATVDPKMQAALSWAKTNYQADLADPASLQRGANIYMQRCLGCHSLKYLRYDSLAQGLGIVDEQGELLDEVVKKAWLFTDMKLTDNITNNLSAADAGAWFGLQPPDLSLVARSRGVAWLYAYLNSFYADPKVSHGANNTVLPNSAMPHVLVDLQTELSPLEYQRATADLVNFLDYVAEPNKLKRQHLGIFMLILVSILVIFSYLLKREYWKDIK